MNQPLNECKNITQQHLTTAEKRLVEIKKDINSRPMESILEWNVIENGVSIESDILFYRTILAVLENQDNPIKIIKQWHQRIVDQLVGTGTHPGPGPWDCKCTSPGDRRLKIIKNNDLRIHAARSRELIKLLECKP